METKTLDDVLAHYGILGMKWGVRRSRAELDRAAGRRRASGKPVTPTKREQKRQAKKAAKTPSEDAKKAQEAVEKAKKGGVQSLSNQELQALNNRMNLEQQYSKLNQKTKSKGEKFLEDLAMDLAKSQAKAATSYAVGQILNPKNKK